MTWLRKFSWNDLDDHDYAVVYIYEMQIKGEFRGFGIFYFEYFAMY